MVKRSAAADNARKHGIFAQDSPAFHTSPLADHAGSILHGPSSEEMVCELKRAEVRNARCQVASFAILTSMEDFLAEAPILSGSNLESFLAELHVLQRLMRYQNDAISNVRKCRIRILNAMEAVGPLYGNSKR